MTRPTNEQRLAKIHQEALEEFDDIQAACRETRLQCLDDRRFYSITGAQWEGPLGEQFENKPRFEFNKTHLAVIRIFSEYRNNRITVDFQPKDGTEDEMAETCNGLFRADEQSCTADEAYDNGFEEGVGGGMGAWRVRACYEDEEDEEDGRQRVRIEPIFDADSCVFFDLDAKRQDKADAKRCYVLTPYTRKHYINEFNDDPAAWPKEITRAEFDWCTPDIVWVCELFKIEERKETVRFFRSLVEGAPDMKVTEADLAADPEMLQTLAATGFREVRQKRVERKVVHKYLLSGGKVLEDCGIIAGRCIPIVPYYAKRWVVDGIERCMGHVRLAKDAQRLSNMLLSWLAEMAARFDIEKPIFTNEQVSKYAVMWAEDNVKKYAYLLADPVTDQDGKIVQTGPIGYTKSPNVPPAMAALVQIAEQALSDLLGNQQAGEQLQPNLSGKAVELIQTRLDMQVFIYISNLAKSMKRCGEIWLSMMRDIAVEESRRMKTVDSSGQPGSVLLNETAFDAEKGATVVKNDITKATFDVNVDVGPSSGSKRAATVRALTGMMSITQDPETSQVLTAMAMLNMEGEGISEVREFFRAKLVRMGAVKPNEEEAAQMQEAQAQQQPDPQSLFLMAEAEKAQAETERVKAETVETIANVELKRAQTAEAYAKAMGETNNQQIASAQALAELMAELTNPTPPGVTA